MARILKPLVGKSEHHVKNTQDFIESIKGIHLNEDQCMVPMMLRQLFTSVPTNKACIIIRQRLEEDLELNQRTSLTIDDIISLLEFCITSTYFSFQASFMSRWRVLPWVSLKPYSSQIYMESFEVEAIRSAPNPPKFWKRYVDDTFTILESSKKEEFLTHLNSIDSNTIHSRRVREDGAMPFPRHPGVTW